MEIVIGLFVLGIAALAAWLLLALFVTRRSLRQPPRQALARALAGNAPLDPADTDWDTETWSFQTHDGLELPVWSMRGSNHGPVTLLIHEWAHARLDWLPFVGEWLDRSSKVLIPELRAHGEAPGRCTLGQLELDDLVVLMGLIEARPIRIVGCGFGATLALRLAASMPDDIEEVVAINPWFLEPAGILERMCLCGMPVRPPTIIFSLVLRMIGEEGLRLGPIPSGPIIRLQLPAGVESDSITSALARHDIDITHVDASST